VAFNTVDVWSFRGNDCDTDHYLVVAKVRERLSINKQVMQGFDMKRFKLKTLNEEDVKKHIHVVVSNTFSALESLDDDVDIKRAWESIRRNTKVSAIESKGYYEMFSKTHSLMRSAQNY
jgi:hypothetical protein